jgi:hypothetical protein
MSGITYFWTKVDVKQKTRFETMQCFLCLHVLFRVADTLARNSNRNMTWHNAKYRGADNHSKHAKAQRKACFALQQCWLSVGALKVYGSDKRIPQKSILKYSLWYQAYFHQFSLKKYWPTIFFIIFFLTPPFTGVCENQLRYRETPIFSSGRHTGYPR